MFENIVLEPVQEELLTVIVEAARNVPRDQRMKFLVAQSVDGDSLIHPGIPKDKSQIYSGDIEALAREGLLALGYVSKGTLNFDVTPLGFRYYEYFKDRSGKPVERVEATVKSYLASIDFQRKYPEAFRKWSSAENLLWKTDTEQQSTTIGHLCRESVQEFANVLVDRSKPPNVTGLTNQKLWPV